MVNFLQRLSPGFQSPASTSPRRSPASTNPLPVGVIVSTGDEVHEREDILNEIDDAYYEQGFDAVDLELGSLSLTRNASAELNAVAEARSLALDCISDTLSMNILRDYDRFDQALNCVTAVRDAVAGAKTDAKVAREHLARCSLEISQGVKVWKNAQKKKNIAKTLGILQKMQTALRLLGGVEDALSEARYGEAVERCLAVGEIVATELEPHGVRAADVLSGEANRLLCDIAEQMFVLLSSMTSGQFDDEAYESLMEGYVHLTDPEKIVGGADLSPGQEIVAAFTAAPFDKVKRVIAGVCARDGGSWEGGKDVEPSLVDLMAKVPGDSLKTCMQMVLKVEFDILMSFRRLEQWHELRGGNGGGQTAAPPTHGEKMFEEIRKSLPQAKRLMWNEVSGSLMAVLQSTKSGHGETFVLVSTWVRDFLKVGKAFTGGSSEVIDSILSHQSVRFFKGHHINCLEALFAVLERETYGEVNITLPWVLNVDGATLPRREVSKGSEGSGSEMSQIADDINLDQCVLHNANPWDDRDGTEPTPTRHYDAKAAFRDHRITLGDGFNLSTTNSFWRLVKWIMEYVSLMHDLPSAAPAIAVGMAELVNLYLMHIYASFMGFKHGYMEPWYASARLEELVTTAMRSDSGTGGIGTYTPAFEAWFPGSALVPLLRDSIAPGGSSSSISLRKASSTTTKTAGKSKGTNPTGAQAVCHSGNLYGLIERAVSSRSITQLARLLHQLCDCGIVPDQADQQRLTAIAKAVPDMHRALYGTCCALLLPTAWIPEAVSRGDNGAYQATDPPLAAAPWTARLDRQLKLLAAQLQATFDSDAGGEIVDRDNSSARLATQDKRLLWSFVFPAVSHSIVDGLAAVKKCTLEGRSAMSLDLQAVSKSLLHFSKTLGASTLTTISSADPEDDNDLTANHAVRYIDDFIKAFYIPIPELHAWAASHPDYTTDQILSVARCAADTLGGPTARGDIAALTAKLIDR